MSHKLNRILVGISGSHRKVLARVAELAKASGASIELHTVVRPVLPLLWLSYDAPRATDLLVSAAHNGLEKLAQKLRKQGLSVSTRVTVDEHVAEGLLKRIRTAGPDLVAIEAHRHGGLSRLLLTQTDFELIRRCPVPLLIVKNSASKSSRVLAAVDPEHAHGKPGSLDEAILSHARALSKLVGGTLHSGYAYLPIMAYVEGPFAPVAYPMSSAEEQHYRTKMKQLFLRLSNRYGIAKGRAHVVLGDPSFQLPFLAKHIRARMVVMGAVSRRALKRLLIGSTAERALDMLPCDVLIVKPAAGP